MFRKKEIKKMIHLISIIEHKVRYKITYNSKVYFKLKVKNPNQIGDYIQPHFTVTMVGFFYKEILPLASIVAIIFSDKLVTLMNCLIWLFSNMLVYVVACFKPIPTFNLATIFEAIFKHFSGLCNFAKVSFVSPLIT
jgi:glucan phosphoethanolaminetransferase (alkaline phosphatase superfamily)